MPTTRLDVGAEPVIGDVTVDWLLEEINIQLGYCDIRVAPGEWP